MTPEVRKILVVTGSRAEFGLLLNTMRRIDNDPSLRLQLIVTGTHLSPEFGMTVSEIEGSGLPISKRIEILLSSDTSIGVTKAIGLGLIGYAEAFDELRPDIVLVLGDRFEILAAAVAATLARIPLAHYHGGELTEGAVDESMRHAITKMAHLHFTATEEYRRRVIQLGEAPDRVYNFGAPGLEGIASGGWLSRTEFESAIGRKLAKTNLLVTFHPVTLEPESSQSHFAELLSALRALDDTLIVFTKPNADMEGRALIKMVDEYCAQNRASAVGFQSLGRLRYFSALAHVDAVVGNSSSGLIEAPSFGLGTVNIGDRQRGRVAGPSVVHCPPEQQAIRKALKTVVSDDFRQAIKQMPNPYGDGRVSERVVDVLKGLDLRDILKKSFHDLPL